MKHAVDFACRVPWVGSGRHTGEGLEPVEPLAEVVARLGLVGMRRVPSSAKSAAVCSDSASQSVWPRLVGPAST